MKVVAKQDEPVKPGGEGAFDLLITGYPVSRGQRVKAFQVKAGGAPVG